MPKNRKNQISVKIIDENDNYVICRNVLSIYTEEDPFDLVGLRITVNLTEGLYYENHGIKDIEETVDEPEEGDADISFHAESIITVFNPKE